MRPEPKSPLVTALFERSEVRFLIELVLMILENFFDYVSSSLRGGRAVSTCALNVPVQHAINYPRLAPSISALLHPGLWLALRS